MTIIESPPFEMPSPDDWREIVGNLELDARQAHELDIVLRHAKADLQAVADRVPARDERGELVAALEALSKALGAVENVVRGRLPELSDALPHASGSAIGDMLTVREIEIALDKKLFTPNLDELQTSPEAPGTLSASEIDAATASMRQAQGIAAGAELLAHIVKRVHEPVRKWLEADRSNRGGRPPDHIREHLIFALAKKSNVIIGEPPTSNGRFLALCDEVFRACDRSTDGLRDAVERILGVRVR